MKILKLSFENLNSLYGRWNIDFTNPEYTDSGIFALVGPTGAGKSTILDAICLALYGETPRLGSLTVGSNEIMSKGTGNCMAEVEFSTKKGHFRATWSQHRSRNAADGKLQGAIHELANVIDGNILSENIKETKKEVEKETGMDFDRFTRSILLSQGKFDSFLKADVEEKSNILEQITGTGIYTEISKMCHERNKLEKEKLIDFQKEIDLTQILDLEKEKEFEEKLKLDEKASKEKEKKIQELSGVVAWLKNISTIESSISIYKEKFKKSENDLERFKFKSEQLDLAKKAVVCEVQYNDFKKCREDCISLTEQLASKQKELPSKEDDVKRGTIALEKIKKSLNETKNDKQKSVPIINRVKELDYDILTQKKSMSSLEKDYNEIKESLKKSKEELNLKNKDLLQKEQELKVVEKYILDNQQDKALTEQLSLIEQQLNSLKKYEEEFSKIESNVKLNQDKLELSKKKKLDKEAEFKVTEEKKVVHEENKKLSLSDLKLHLKGNTLESYRDKKEALSRERLLIQNVINLKEERKKLVNGVACPLCGALEHPFSNNDIPKISEVDKEIESLELFIKQAVELENKFNDLEKSEVQFNKVFTQSQRELDQANYDFNTCGENLKNSLEQFEESRKELLEHKTDVLKVVNSFGINEITDSGAVLNKLFQRKEAWLRNSEKEHNIWQAIADMKTSIAATNAKIEADEKSFSGKYKDLDEVKKNIFEKGNARRELFADKDPDNELKRLDDEIVVVELKEKEIKIALDKVKEMLIALTTHIDGIENQLVNCRKELKASEAVFLELAKKNNFVDEADYLSKSLSWVERTALEKESQDLHKIHDELKSLLLDRENNLKNELAKNLTTEKQLDLEVKLANLEKEKSELYRTIGSIDSTLKANSQAKEKLKDVQSKLSKQRVELDRWSKLDSLIGQANGKKYRTFAQSLTFQIMISHANVQLRKMSDRYLLDLDENAELELFVVDAYQNALKRSVKNLSGGESFIVSLALALGLAQMSSDKIKVDSLFLDEGFGTLDAESLEDALTTLAELREEDKLIGVISHVPSMKECISTQIEVTTSNGKSKLSGPGVKAGNIEN